MENTHVASPKAVGAHLKSARIQAGLSRAKLGELTGISPRALEKIEAGTQEVSASRLSLLCDALEIDPKVFISAPKEQQKEIETRLYDFNELGEADAVDLLNSLSQMRANNYTGSTRQAIAIAQRADNALKMLEATDLYELATDQGIVIDVSVNETDTYRESNTDPFQSHRYWDQVQSRIVDMATLGVDVFSLETEELQRIADELAEKRAIEQPGFFSDWPSHDELYAIIRPAIYQAVTAGVQLDGLLKPKD